MSKQKSIKKTVYILTEGKTEEAYFARIGEILGNDTDWNYSVTVEVREIVDGSKTDPVKMVKEAKEHKGSFNEIWVVFDKDRERDILNEKAISLAIKSKIKVAFSSISFEHWILLHFEKSTFAFQRSDCESRSTNAIPVVCVCNGTICASTYIKQKYYPTFYKAKSKLFDELKNNSANAIENAAWLRLYKSPYADIHTINPYSDVDILLAELLNLRKVEYHSIGQVFNFDKASILVRSFSRNGNTFLVTLNINNHSAVAVPMNNYQQFSLLDDQRVPFSYTVNQVGLIEPGTNQDFVLTFTVNQNSQLLTFRASTTDFNFLVDLI